MILYFYLEGLVLFKNFVDVKSSLFIFVFIYAVLTFGYLIYRYFFSIVHSFEEIKITKKPNYYPQVSIIIPSYNEEPRALEKCIISSCDNSYPKKEVIVIDDGSKNIESWNTVKRLQKKYGFKAIQFKKNKGKRDAMTLGFRLAKGELLITMDSDSIIPNGNSILELVKPFQNPKVGAVAGNIEVSNKSRNLLTRLQWARYWIAFHIEKSSQSPYNSVTCCPGPFSAYRKEYLMNYLDEWSNQVFLGKKCTYGDDRGLTTLMLRQGYRVKFAKYALCITDVPESFRKYTRQQIRWKKSFIRENYYISKFIKRMNPLMKIEYYWFWTAFPLGYIAKIIAFVFIATGDYSLMSFGVMIIFVSVIHYIYAFTRKPGRIGYYGILYGFLNEFWIMWLFWYALFTLKETGWGTR
jgi:hyaluronan synthase/N-acetylglucosaminyltransferase